MEIGIWQLKWKWGEQNPSYKLLYSTNVITPQFYIQNPYVVIPCPSQKQKAEIDIIDTFQYGKRKQAN